MMNLKLRPFMPRFVNRVDRYLLLNKPYIWSTRAHLVCWLSLLSFGLFFALFMLVPNDPREYSEVYLPTFFLAVLASIGVIFWLIFLFRFNVFKRYGTVTGKGFLIEFLLYFIGFISIVSIPFIPPGVESLRAHLAYSTEEMASDIERINFVFSQLAYDSLDVDWKRDSIVIDDSIVKAHADPDYGFDETYTIVDDVNYCTENYARREIKSADSVEWISEKELILLSAPDYHFIDNNRVQEHQLSKVMSNKELYFLVHRMRPSVDLTALRQEYKAFQEKYSMRSDRYYYSEMYDLPSYGFWEKLQLSKLRNGIQNIASRKYSWYPEFWGIYLRIWLYTSLGLTLLLFVFRHSTVRTFFLSILTGILLSIITGFITVFTRGDEENVLMYMLLYAAVFLLIVLFSKGQKTRSVIEGIALNLFTVIIAFVPLIATWLYIELQRDYNRMMYGESFNSDFAIALHSFAELGGGLLLLILLPTLLYKSYRRWYALPEE